MAHRMCYINGQCFEINAEAITVDDLDIKGHPNAVPWAGTLLIVDTPSDKAPQGAQGHRIQVSSEVAENLLPTLVGMGINYSDSFDKHDPKKKIGVITSAWIDGTKVKVKGILYAKDFPEAVKDIQANTPRLGMSMELADVMVKDGDAQVWELDDFKFTGGTILKKSAAAYYKTALAAAASVLGRGGEHMAQKSKTARVAAANDGRKEATKHLAAAIGVSVASVLKDPLEQIGQAIQAQADITEKMLHAAEGGGFPFEKFKKKKKEDASEEEDVEAGAEEILDDELEAEGKKKVQAQDDASEEEEVDPSEEEEMDDASDEYEAAGGEDSSENADSQPGELNKDAMTKEKKNATAHLHAAADRSERLERSLKTAIREIRAAAVEKKNSRRQVKQLQAQIESMEAQLERFSDQIPRRSVTPETQNLLEKAGYDIGELMASGKKLSVGEVDRVLANCGVQLDPLTRAAIKNGLLGSGLMDTGEVVRTR